MTKPLHRPRHMNKQPFLPAHPPISTMQYPEYYDSREYDTLAVDAIMPMMMKKPEEKQVATLCRARANGLLQVAERERVASNAEEGGGRRRTFLFQKQECRHTTRLPAERFHRREEAGLVRR